MDAYEHPPDLDPPADEHGATGIVMSGSDLARILGVGTSSLSQSARNGWQCRGYRVAEWAQWDGDRIAAYDVPAAVVDELTDPDGPTFAESAPVSAPRSEPRRLASGREPRGFASSVSPAWPEALASAPAGWPAHPYASPNPLGVEQIAGELRRVIEEMHKQAERRNEEFERTRQALREDNDRLRDDLRRAQDQHAKEIREAERQLARVKEQAFEKRFELRERLLEAQTEARLAEGGVEDSWLERLVERHGEGLASIVGGVAAAFAGRLAAPPDDVAPDDWADDEQDLLDDGEPDETGSAPRPFTPRLGSENASPEALQPDALHLESQAEMASRLAALVAEGSPGDIAAVVAELRGQLDAAGAARLAAEVVPLLVASDAAAVAARLRPAVAATFPLALHLPPATAVMMAREAGVVAGEAEAAWLQRVMSELQTPASDVPADTPASDPA